MLANNPDHYAAAPRVRQQTEPGTHGDGAFGTCNTCAVAAIFSHLSVKSLNGESLTSGENVCDSFGTLPGQFLPL